MRKNLFRRIKDAFRCSFGDHEWSIWAGKFMDLPKEHSHKLWVEMKQGKIICYCHMCGRYKAFPSNKVPHGAL